MSDTGSRTADPLPPPRPRSPPADRPASTQRLTARGPPPRSLLARFVYRNGTAVLAEANVIKARPTPAAPEVFVTEEAVGRHLVAITASVNAAFATCWSLAVCDDNVLVLKCVGALFALARIADLLGTTLLAFLAFVAVFTLPKGYEVKHKEVDAAVALVLTSARGVAAQVAAKAKDLKKTAKAGDAEAKKAL